MTTPADLNETVYSACTAVLTEVGAVADSASPIYQEGGELPAIVYRVDGEDRLTLLDGEAVMGIRYQLDMRAEDYSLLTDIDGRLVEGLGRLSYDISPPSDIVEDDISRGRVYRRTRSMMLRL